MVHPLLRPRVGAIVSAVVVGALIFAFTDLEGINRLWTTGLSFVVAYLTFNATTVYFDLE